MAAAAVFTVTGATIKAAADSSSTGMIVFARNLVALLVLLPWALRQGYAGVRTGRPAAHLWRSGLGLAAMYCFFYALGELPLAEAMLLNYSAPLFVPLLAWWWMAEKPAAASLAAIVLGMLGVALIVKPGADGLLAPAALIGAASSVLAAGAFVGVRRLTRSEPAIRIVFYFSLIGTVISAVPLYWQWQLPDLRTALLLIACGLSATLGQLLLTRAYACAPAARVAPFSYSSVVFSGALGWTLWQETPDLQSLLGALIIVITCIVLGRQRSAPT